MTARELVRATVLSLVVCAACTEDPDLVAELPATPDATVPVTSIGHAKDAGALDAGDPSGSIAHAKDASALFDARASSASDAALGDASSMN